MKEVTYNPIGIINTPFKKVEGMPIQAASAQGVKGIITINKEYADGLKDIEDFSYILLIYHLHKSSGYSLHVKPFLDDNKHGIFATRAPKRPCPIGLSRVKLLKVEANQLHIEDVDILDGTPLLDIKPYIPDFDIVQCDKIGWYKDKVQDLDEVRSDGRFKK